MPLTEPYKPTGQPDVSVILPTFQERENIVPLVHELRREFKRVGVRYEILVIDDRSPDGTAMAARAAFADDSGVVVIERAANPGLAFSIREGIEKSQGSVILVMDTDFNHQPKDAVLIFEVARLVDLGIGSRFIFGGGMPNRLRYFLSYLYNIFMRISLGTRIDDNLSGLFAIQRAALFKLDFDKIFWGYGDYFFRLLLLSQRERMTHVQVPVFYGERAAGGSKTRFISIFMRYTREVARLIYLRAANRW
ncbi:dolichol-phosphate mannosyltransferase, fused to membrane-bound GtrA-like domain [Nitrobacter sp. Nb-311A]|uniref:glycosyltransferase n=1 Tax=Nitrobacter sp. Nb-311A TaxID=314253 RepID=UPI0000687A62|nr:dolichol-phosphate mannosyltransferase, fused to membrane-bound GtrA-like domain [Nitrobacter sp. Nb-311A]